MTLRAFIASSVAIAHKDLRLLVRDRMALFWVFVFPLLFAQFIGAVLEAGMRQDLSPLQIAWVDESQGKAAVLRDALEAQGAQLIALSLSQARDHVRTAQAAVLVRVPRDFPSGAIALGRDPSRPTEASLVHQWLQHAGTPQQTPPALRIERHDIHDIHDIHDRLDEAARVPGAPGETIGLVLPAMILWGLLGCSATFAVSLVSERNTGTLTRLRMAPVPRGVILSGKALSCFLSCMLNASILTLVALTFLSAAMPAPGKWLLVLACVSLCFTGLTMLLSTLGKTEQSVAGAGWAVLLVLAMLGGAMVPLAFLPSWLVTASEASPVRWSILALEGALTRGFSVTELLPTLLSLLALGTLSFGIGSFAMSRQQA